MTMEVAEEKKCDYLILKLVFTRESRRHTMCNSLFHAFRMCNNEENEEV